MKYKIEVVVNLGLLNTISPYDYPEALKVSGLATISLCVLSQVVVMLRCIMFLILIIGFCAWFSLD